MPEMNTPDLTVAIFDQLFERPDGKLWGARHISKFLGVSVDAVYDLARRPDVPIYRPGGRYFALRSELTAWLKSK